LQEAFGRNSSFY